MMQLQVDLALKDAEDATEVGQANSSLQGDSNK